jgi:hypothetical protein
MTAYRQRLDTIGKRNEHVAGKLKIVRYQNRADGSHRVEFYLVNMKLDESYAAVCNVKKAFEKKYGFSEAKEGDLPFPEREPLLNQIKAEFETNLTVEQRAEIIAFLETVVRPQ